MSAEQNPLQESPPAPTDSELGVRDTSANHEARDTEKGDATKNASTESQHTLSHGPSYQARHLERLYDSGSRVFGTRTLKGVAEQERKNFDKDYIHRRLQDALTQLSSHQSRLERMCTPTYNKDSFRSTTESDTRFKHLFEKENDLERQLVNIDREMRMKRIFHSFKDRIGAMIPFIDKNRSKRRELVIELDDCRLEIDRAIDVIYKEELENIKGLVEDLKNHVRELTHTRDEMDRQLKNKFRESITYHSNKLKQRAETTATLLEQGELQISRLAEKYDAIVVHAIPIEVWEQNRTKGNNNEIDSTALDTREKIAIVQRLRPDLSASVVSTRGLEQGVMYPLGLILDGHIIASYPTDRRTKTKKLARIIHDGATLNDDPQAQFAEIAQTPKPLMNGSDWNECIVHEPHIVGFLIDEAMSPMRMEKFNTGNEEIRLSDRDDEKLVMESLAQKHMGKKNLRIYTAYSSDESRGYGHKYAVAQWDIDAIALSTEFVTKNFPQHRIYYRRTDGIYDERGKKNSSGDIYASGVSHSQSDE